MNPVRELRSLSRAPNEGAERFRGRHCSLLSLRAATPRRMSKRGQKAKAMIRIRDSKLPPRSRSWGQSLVSGLPLVRWGKRRNSVGHLFATLFVAWAAPLFATATLCYFIRTKWRLRSRSGCLVCDCGRLYPSAKPSFQQDRRIPLL